MASLRFGQFPVQRMVFEPKAFDLLGGTTAHKEPRAIDWRRHKCAGQCIGTVGKYPGVSGSWKANTRCASQLPMMERARASP